MLAGLHIVQLLLDAAGLPPRTIIYLLASFQHSSERRLVCPLERKRDLNFLRGDHENDLIRRGELSLVANRRRRPELAA